MAAYFRQVPNFDYVSRYPGDDQISNYITVKNLFKRGKLRDDIFQNLTYFDKYKIIGDERPDTVAYKFYDDSTLDWVILLSNNIVNIQTEWPLAQNMFEKVMLEKYGGYEELYSNIHHYETIEVRNSNGVVILPAGLRVSKDYYFEYYDNQQTNFVGELERITGLSSVVREVTNYDYELELEEAKRNIFVLKARYLSIVFNDMENIMKYKKGSQQYVSETLKKGDNIRLFT